MNRPSILNLSAITALGLVFSVTGAIAQTKSLKDQLVGTWSLVSFDSVAADGTKQAIFKGQRKGMFMFDAAGHYMLSVFSADRPKWKSPKRSDVTPDEFKSAAQDTIAQFGTWSVDESSKTLDRRLEIALNPNNAGGEAKQEVVVSGDELKLTDAATPFSAGKAEEVWRRVK